jgi:hypothetical protein
MLHMSCGLWAVVADDYWPRPPAAPAEGRQPAVQCLHRAANILITDVLGRGFSLKQITIKQAGTLSEAEYKYVRRRFRECLATLASRFGFANSDRVRPVGSLMNRS